MPSVPPLSAETVIHGGGWHPRHARVLKIVQKGACAVALVDGNGDGAECESELWGYDESDGWRSLRSAGAGPSPEWNVRRGYGDALARFTPEEQAKMFEVTDADLPLDWLDE